MREEMLVGGLLVVKEALARRESVVFSRAGRLRFQLRLLVMGKEWMSGWMMHGRMDK